MSMLTNTLGRYFAGRFLIAALGVFASIFVLLVLVDYIEMVRRTSSLASASAIMVAETSLFVMSAIFAITDTAVNRRRTPFFID